MKLIGWVLVPALVSGTMTAAADVLLLDAINAAPPNQAEGLLRPRNGITMTSVRSNFGEPASVVSAVGEPPITRWVYPSYTVYFEHNLVLNVVVHRP